MLKVYLSSHAQKFLEKIDASLHERILSRLRKLAENPFPSDVKRVLGRKEKVFRIRVGDYRVLYIVFQEKNEILVSDIDKRPRVY